MKHDLTFKKPPEACRLGLWSDGCGSAEVLWRGDTLAEAAAAWQLHAGNGEDVHLTGLGWGILARHDEMAWRYGSPKSTFSCPICHADSPHQHTAQEVSRHRALDALRQRVMDKRWESIGKAIAQAVQ